MLTLVIKDCFEKACKTIKQASIYSEAFEIRLDLIKDLSLDKLAFLRNLSEKKIIFTLRTKDQGGAFVGSFENYLKSILATLILKPDYIDLEIGTPQMIIDEIKLTYPSIQIILSSHHFKTISSIEEAFRVLMQYKADIYKLAINGGAVEALDMLLTTKKLHQQNIKVIGIVMGEEGVISRILSKIVGNYLTFCSDNANFGQLSLEEMTEIYHVHTTSKSTKIFGLVGNPVTASPSHFTHNKLFQQCGIDAIYVKIQLKEHELSNFFDKAKKLFEGFSITAPFKEKVFPLAQHVSEDAKRIGAINTLKRKGDSWVGENTDRLGALRSLSQLIDLKNKRCLIIGLGGASKAILHELIKAKACVTILSRSLQQKNLVQDFDHYSFDHLDKLASEKRFDVIIQATSCELQGNLLPENIYHLFKNQPLVFETLVNPRLTFFLQKALEQKCPIIQGYQMFLHQAAFQFSFWFQTLTPQEAFEYLSKAYLSFEQ